MAKNFSVEWLSQSFYSKQTDLFNKRDTTYSPRSQTPPECLTHAINESLLSIELEEPAKDSRMVFTPVSPNNSCGYTSASESEVGDDSEGDFVHYRRMRTKFTSNQICRLEKTFNKHKYLGATQRRKIAEKLGLSETQVKTWFQNRRMKLKREIQDMQSDSFALTSMIPPLIYSATQTFQHHVSTGQLPAYNQSAQAFYPHLQYLQRLPVQNIVKLQPFHPVMMASCYY